ncbi:hypothetical protein FNH22_24795 [Fulvivirga sp. M361]|uniref:hypothetical protein n=1 Tax=Fulvivirga sp. M361 TaxID=2594266 RepID=UPI00117B277F|nr:hypothetical protein [Fulvivirga sp. M361]TRX50874.1 hypothetical protein FNH22_24795 [Fulvivirga sp. M361]
MKKILPFFVLFICSCTSTDDLNPIVDQFLTKYENEGSDSAINYLFSTNKSIGKEQIIEVKTSLSKVLDQLGKYHGYDLLTSKKVDNTLQQYSFLMKYDLQPIRFKITLYNPKNEWRVQNFQYDSEIIDELEQASTLSK